MNSQIINSFFYTENNILLLQIDIEEIYKKYFEAKIPLECIKQGFTFFINRYDVCTTTRYKDYIWWDKKNITIDNLIIMAVEYIKKCITIEVGYFQKTGQKLEFIDFKKPSKLNKQFFSF